MSGHGRGGAARTLALERVLPPVWRPDLLSRERLIAQLEQSIQTCRLTAICAPAGYGKTTLLADFARRTSLRCAWLRLDERDRDPSQLRTMLAEAVAQRASAERAAARESGPASGDWLAGRSPAIIELANRLARTPEHTVVMWDDFHAIADSPAAIRTAAEFVRKAPDHVRFVVSSRMAVPRTVAELRPFEDMGLVDSDTLRFTPTEIDGLLEQFGVPVEDWSSAVQALAICEGWPGAVAMAIKGRLLQPGAGGEPTGAIEPEAVFGTLAAGLLDGIPPADRRFLHLIAHLERINPDLCNACLRTTDAAKRLDRLAAVALFLEHRPGDDNYRLHGLFRHFLIAQSSGRCAFSPEQHRLAAAWFREEAESASEIKHLIAAGDLTDARDRLATVAPELARDARWHTMLSLLECYEAASSEDLPLELVRQMARAQVATGATQAAIDTVSEAIRRTAGTHADLVALHVTRSYARRIRGEFDLAIEDAETALRYSELLARGEQVKVLRVLGQTHASNLEPSVATRYFGDAVRLAEDHDLRRSQAMLTSDLAMFEYLQGRIDQAVRTAEMAVQLASDLGYVDAKLFALNNLGSALRLKGEYTHALESFGKVLTLAQRHKERRVEALSWLGQGDVYIDLLVTDAARRCYVRGHSLAHDLDEADIMASANRALSVLFRDMGDLMTSRQMLADTDGLGLRGDKYTQALHEIEDGALCIAEGNLDLARHRLAGAADVLEGAQFRVDSARARLYLAFAHFLSEGIAAALPELERIAELVTQIQTSQFLVPVADRMPRLWGAVEAVGRSGLHAVIAQPDKRPRVKPELRGLPPTARPDDPHPCLLSAREREIVIGLSEGLSRDVVADRMGLSLSTINKAISSLYASTGFEHAHQLVAWAFRCGLYDPHNPPPPQTGRIGLVS